MTFQSHWALRPNRAGGGVNTALFQSHARPWETPRDDTPPYGLEVSNSGPQWGPYAPRGSAPAPNCTPCPHVEGERNPGSLCWLHRLHSHGGWGGGGGGSTPKTSPLFSSPISSTTTGAGVWCLESRKVWAVVIAQWEGFAFHIADSGSISGILYGPLSPPDVFPKCRANRNSWIWPDVTQSPEIKQNKIKLYKFIGCTLLPWESLNFTLTYAVEFPAMICTFKAQF